MDKEFEAKPVDPDLEATIKEVKQEFQNLVIKKKDLVLILGRAFQKTVRSLTVYVRRLKIH